MEMEKTHQNLWEVAKAVPRGKFMAINMHIRKKKKDHTWKSEL